MTILKRTYMMPPGRFIAKVQQHMVCKLHMSIYGFKQASRSWNIRFEQAMKSFDFEKITNKPCVYKKCEHSMVVILILYEDDILFIRNDVRALSTVKIQLASYFDMKNLGEASYILRIKLLRDYQNKMLKLIPSCIYR